VEPGRLEVMARVLQEHRSPRWNGWACSPDQPIDIEDSEADGFEMKRCDGPAESLALFHYRRSGWSRLSFQHIDEL
jgi:hypothetical protein